MVDVVEEIKKIKIYARENNVPIIEDDSLQFLTTYILKNRVKKVLEVGTAIGYSAIMMALTDKDISVVTIERDKERYNIAVKNISEFNLNSRINIINDDAFNVNLKEKYDLIFIDAAKAQYINFFEKFKNNLDENGVIVSDNLKFQGLVDGNDDNLSRNVKGLVRKLRLYIDFLQNNKEFKTIFYNIGDGVAVSIKLDK